VRGDSSGVGHGDGDDDDDDDNVRMLRSLALICARLHIAFSRDLAMFSGFQFAVSRFALPRSRKIISF
jgi:hypothetical protein